MSPTPKNAIRPARHAPERPARAAYDLRARRALAAADPRLARVIAAVGPCRLVPRAEGTHFDAVARSIVYQQLSGKAAATIHGRVLALFGGAGIDPDAFLRTPDEPLRAAGLSRQKLGYLRDLAERATSGAIPFAALDTLPDDEVIRALVSVKGVGRWTAQMFLMFRLGRPDVLPDLDLGVQKGIQLVYGLRKLPTPKQVLARGEQWAPWRSVASWYFWRVLDGPYEL